MQFEVNGQVYFLNFVEEQGRWFLIKPSASGVEAIPVYVDAPKHDRFGSAGEKGHNIQN